MDQHRSIAGWNRRVFLAKARRKEDLPEFPSSAQRALAIALLVMPLLVMALTASGCRSKGPERRMLPHEAARARVQFLRQHGTELDREQVRQIRRIPYSKSARTLDTRMTSVLNGEELRAAELRRVVTPELLGERRRVLGRSAADVYKPEPPPPGHWAPGHWAPGHWAPGHSATGSASEDREEREHDDEGSTDPGEEDSP